MTEFNVEQMPLELIARAAHEANRSYCATIGDAPIDRWERTPEIVRNSLIEGVRQHVIAATEGSVITPYQSHQRWLDYKTAEGWKFGPTKNVELKLHPNMVPFDELPKTQQAKDYIFCGVVGLFIELLLLPETFAILHRQAREGLVLALRPDPEDAPPPPVSERARMVLADPKLRGDDRPEESHYRHQRIADLKAVGQEMQRKEDAALRADTKPTEQEKNTDAEVENPGRLATGGDDAPDHALPVSPVRKASEGSAAELGGGGDGSGGESREG